MLRVVLSEFYTEWMDGWMEVASFYSIHTFCYLYLVSLRRGKAIIQYALEMYLHTLLYTIDVYYATVFSLNGFVDKSIRFPASFPIVR